MPKVAIAYIRIIDAINYRIGRFVMFGLFAIMGVLLWSSISKTFFLPSLWTLEVAQFFMIAYYFLGGPYSIQLGSNVRMDLFYHQWSPRKKAAFDIITVFFLIFYLLVLLYGAISSSAYSLGHYSNEPLSFFGQLIAGFVTGGPETVDGMIGRLERSSSAWRPYLWPIKSILAFGAFLMLMQATSELLKDFAQIRGVDIRKDT